MYIYIYRERERKREIYKAEEAAEGQEPREGAVAGRQDQGAEGEHK